MGKVDEAMDSVGSMNNNYVVEDPPMKIVKESTETKTMDIPENFNQLPPTKKHQGAAKPWKPLGR